MQFYYTWVVVYRYSSHFFSSIYTHVISTMGLKLHFTQVLLEMLIN